KAPGTATTTPSTPATGKPLTREQQERQAHLEKLLGDLETVVVRPAATDRILGRLARITNTPEVKIREQFDGLPGVTMGQFYVATLIAKRANTKQEQVLAAPKSGNSSGEIAWGHRMAIADLNESVLEATAAARDAERKAQRVEQSR